MTSEAVLDHWDNFCVGGNAKCYGGAGGKVGSKLEKLSVFQGNQGQLFQFCPGKIEIPFLHTLDSILSKMSQKI